MNQTPRTGEKMTTYYTIIASGNNTGTLYHGNERVDGVGIVARDDGGLDDGGLIDWSVIADDGAVIWAFLRDAAEGAEMVQHLITNSAPGFDTDTVIDEEGMGFDSVGPVDSLVVNDGGMLGNEAHSERADLSSEAAFRDQVRRWKAAVSA